ncbi:MAG: hypothetical protein Q4Q13_07295, partial [Vagococcus sp.]|nr:hypothetical protein [Vagococcus sp.]
MSKTYKKNEPLSVFVEKFNELIVAFENLESRYTKIDEATSFLKNHIAPRLSERPIAFEGIESLKKADFLIPGDVCLIFISTENNLNFVDIYKVDFFENHLEDPAEEVVRLKEPTLCAYKLNLGERKSVDIDYINVELAKKLNKPSDDALFGQFLSMGGNGPIWKNLDIVDDVTIGGRDKVLSAEQGKYLNDTKLDYKQTLKIASDVAYNDHIFSLESNIYKNLNDLYKANLASSVQNINDIVTSPLVMDTVVVNDRLITAMMNSHTAWGAIMASEEAFNKLLENPISSIALSNNLFAFHTVINNVTTLDKIINSNTTMTAIADSDVAMTAVIGNT